jgi:predicted amino acid dehydrogenase
VLHGVDSLHTYARLAMPLLVRRPYVSYFPRGRAGDGIQQSLLTRFVGQADVIVSDLRYLLHHCPRDLRGKVVITDSVDPEAEADLRDRGVSVLCCLTPQPLAGQRLDLPVLHAMIVAHGGKDPAAFDDDDYRRALDTLACPPRMAHPQGEKRVRNKFAYLYCPPGRFDLFRDPLVRFLRAMPDAVQRAVEKAAADLPITTWARVTGIRSPTGVEAEGFILFLPATAEQITERGRPWAEKRLQQAVTKAERLGARILGVGAFARTLSEATARVAPESAIPVTSGAAYVVSASMWAAKNAVVALGIGRDPIGRAVGTAIVVGGGDPTGAAAAALLALVFTRLVVIDKDADRALSIAEEIARENPHCQVESATSPDAYVGDADLVVTGLVPGWRGAVTIDVLKPGAVWADCARPSEASLLDADSRPDVLVVYAGELELPGPAELGPSLGPPPKVAFASFAEAVVLALEGRFECFSLGADVDLRRVKEIYKSGLRHDLRLASMRGPRGPIRESEIRLVRARADEKRTARG